MKRRHSIGALASLGLIGTCAVGGTRADRAASELPERSNAFAWDMYQQLKSAEGNFQYSPYSLSSALAMMSLGARGPTAQEVHESLHVDSLKDALHPAFSIATKALAPGPGSSTALKVANRLWGQQGQDWRPDFRLGVQKFYGAEFAELDFTTPTAADKATSEINGWVERQTNEQIKDLLPEGALRPSPPTYVSLVLVNGIWFKGKWALPFDKAATKAELFHISPKSKIQALMMNRRGSKYRYGETEDLQLLELPYEGDQLSMVILLPKVKHGLSAIEPSFNAQNLKRWLSGLEESREVVVTVPKFKVTWSTKLRQPLTNLGMRTVFDEGQADFSGMNGRKAGQPDALCLAEVFHKVFVEVNEEGTEAAAATALTMMRRTSYMPPLPPATFRADHPFVYLIRDRRSGQVLFIGRFVRPQ